MEESMMVVGVMNEVLGLEFQQLVDLVAYVVYSLKGLFFENFQFFILHLHLLNLFEFLIELFVEGMQDSSLEGQCTAANR
jgi:hypothetical protein